MENNNLKSALTVSVLFLLSGNTEAHVKKTKTLVDSMSIKEETKCGSALLKALTSSSGTFPDQLSRTFMKIKSHDSASEEDEKDNIKSTHVKFPYFKMKI